MLVISSSTVSDSGFVGQDSASNQKTSSQSFTTKLNRFDRDISQGGVSLKKKTTCSNIVAYKAMIIMSVC